MVSSQNVTGRAASAPVVAERAKSQVDTLLYALCPVLSIGGNTCS